MVQRLMLGAHLTGRNPSRHRFHAFPVARQKQTRAIGCKRLTPVGMSDRSAQMLDIRLKTQRHALSGSQIHGSLMRNESGIRSIAWFDNL
jgi:hypothetical protein